MKHDAFAIAVLIVFHGYAMIFGFVLGTVTAQLATDFGRKGGTPARMRRAMAGGVSLTVLLPLILWMLGGFDIYLASLLVLLSGVATLVVVKSLNYTGAMLTLNARRIGEEATLASRFALSSFERLDADGDGLIGIQDLETAMATERFDPRHLAYLRQNLQAIGHATGSRLTARKRLLVSPIEAGYHPVHELAETPVFGASREEIRDHLSRLSDRLGPWL